MGKCKGGGGSQQVLQFAVLPRSTAEAEASEGEVEGDSAAAVVCAIAKVLDECEWEAWTDEM